MKKLMILLIIIGVIAVVVFIVKNVVNDIDKVTNVEEKYLQVEISNDLNKLLSSKLVEASSIIQGTKNDLSTAYYENKLLDEYLVAQDLVKPDEKSDQVLSADGNGKVYKVYYINVDKFSEEEHLYGNGKNLESGDVFTLEPKITVLEDGTEKSTGIYEFKYYDSEKKSTIIEEIELYATNKT